MLKLIFVFFLFTPLISKGQTTNIDSDRPGQAISANPMSPYHFQIQTGADLYKYNSPSEFKTLIPSVTLRYGITKNSEINYSTSSSFDFPVLANHFIGGISNGIGLRTRIDQSETLNLSTQTEALVVQYLPQENGRQLNLKTVFISSAALSQKMNFLLNLGLNYNTRSKSFSTNYILNVNYTFSKNSTFFIENYGNFGVFSFETFWDGGLAYCLTPNFQLDCSFGASILSNTRNYFISTGLSYKLESKNKLKQIDK
jgi:hypothetical protein